MESRLKRLAPFMTLGCFLLSSPLLPSSFSLFWHPWPVFGAEFFEVAAALLCGLVLYGLALAKLASSLRARFSAIFIVAYAACSVAKLFVPTEPWGFLLSCLCVALSVAPFCVWLRAISGLGFHDALSVSACSVALMYAVAFLGTCGFVNAVALSAVFSIAGSAFPLAWVVRALQSGIADSWGAYAVEKASPAQQDGRPSLQTRIVAVACDCCSGLFLFVMSAAARTRAFEAGAIPQEYRLFEMLALPVGALFVVALLLVKREQTELSRVQSEYLPIFAALFFVLCSFGAETPLFGIGFLLSQAALGALVVVSIAAIASLWSKGEASIFVLTATVLGGLLLALFFGQLISFVVEPQRVGALLLVIASIYFSGVMLSALASLRSLIEKMARSVEPRGAEADGPSRAIELSDACDALASEKGLSPREREVLQYVASGHNSPYIANKLVISEYTVRTHMRNAYRKAGVSSKEELIQLVEAKRFGA